jgi:N4-gp56 family major capsid protein
MAQTDFGAQKPQVIFNWEQKAYKAYRDALFFKNYQGKNGSNIVERITKPTKNDKGQTGAMLHLIADLPTGGVIGDNRLLGRQQKLQSYWISVEVDQISNAVVNTGRLDDQGSVDDFRMEGKDRLGRVDAQTWDELHFLTASGISYAMNCDGSLRVPNSGQDDLSTLRFAASVTAPTANRHFNWNGTALVAGDTTTITTAYTPTYSMIVKLMAKARSQRVPPIRIGGKEYYLLLVHPYTYAQLKLDTMFNANVINAMPRSADNPVFTGATITIDGAIIATHNSVFNTLGATAGVAGNGGKWGSGNTVDGTRSLLLGAQALGYVDMELPVWGEEELDHGRQQSVALQHMGGLIKPVFYNIYTKTYEDFAVIAVNHAISS